MNAKEEKTELQRFGLDQIVRDLALQVRAAGLCDERVADMAEVLREGGRLPAVLVFRVTDRENRPYLVGGWHRDAAHDRAGLESIQAEVRTGTYRDALLAAAAENVEHDSAGMHRTRADKRRAVAMMIAADPQCSNASIARAVRVSPTTVETVRATIQIGESTTRRGRDGRTIETANIGRTVRRDGVVAYRVPAVECVRLFQTPAGHEGASLYPLGERQVAVSWRVFTTEQGGFALEITTTADGSSVLDGEPRGEFAEIEAEGTAA